MPNQYNRAQDSGPAHSIAELLSREGADFVSSAYLTFFRRHPDPAGLENYLRRLDAGDDKVELAREMRFSAEGLECSVDLPDLPKLMQYEADADPRAVPASVATADQMFSLNDALFVRVAYLKVLRRQADPAGATSYVQQLSSGLSRRALLEDLRRSAEGSLIEARLRQWELVAESKSPLPDGHKAPQQGAASEDIGRKPCAVMLMSDLLGCPEREFVANIGEVLLGRQLDDAELAEWMRRLREGLTRQETLREVWRMPEAVELRAFTAEIDRLISRRRFADVPTFRWMAGILRRAGAAQETAQRLRRIESEVDSLRKRLGGGLHQSDRWKTGMGSGDTAVARAGDTRGERANDRPFGSRADAALQADASHGRMGEVRNDWRLEIDIPAVRDGVATDKASGPIMIVGWALSRDGVTRIEVAVDGIPLGHAHYGVARQDVAAALPEWGGALHSGFVFHAPARALPDGRRRLELTVCTKAGRRHSSAFILNIAGTVDPEAIASIRRHISRGERELMEGILADLRWQPHYQLYVTGFGEAGGTAAIRRTLDSLVGQSWGDWTALLLAADSSAALAIREALGDVMAGDDGRVRVVDVSAAGETRMLGTDDELIGILRVGDELGQDALCAFAVASGQNASADMFYADEVRRAGGKQYAEAFCKPDYSPTLLSSMNYIGRPLVLRPGLSRAAGLTVDGLLREGIYSVTLRCEESAKAVHHVRELLSRTDQAGSEPSHLDAEALERAAGRRNFSAQVLAGAAPGTWRVRRDEPVAGMVSIIVPTCAARGLVETCLKSIRTLTANRNFEIICTENIPESQAQFKPLVRELSDQMLPMPSQFNWSRFNNLGARASTGRFLLFLNDDVEVMEPFWLDAMLEEAVRPEVGIVGARLLYPNRTVQHAGMFLGEHGGGRHAFRFNDAEEPGYFGLALARRDVIAVTGACMMVRRDVFDAMGGFEESHDIINNDLDFCLRAHARGLFTVYTPFATLIHHERASRGDAAESFDATGFALKWGAFFAGGDPFHNPRLSRRVDEYRVDDEYPLASFPRRRLLERGDVKEILVVKLDHIGDFITALPAIRRLKSVFPDARLTVLGAPATEEIAVANSAIDRYIAFEFFHAKSQMGERELQQADWDAFEGQLGGLRFDLAIDLRKHKSTRHLLRRARARVRAGYDSFGQFPWLDIALDDHGDVPLVHKRNHMAESLLQLVAAVEAATADAVSAFDPAPRGLGASEIPASVRHVFVRPVIAFHAGAGNVNKEWPEVHVTSLIRLLIDRNDVSVLLLGGAQDRDLSWKIVAQVARPDRVVSLAGEVPLRDLARLLATCALFIGNDSGPKHIAAAAGVPTIGIHSGVVSPIEWAPLGKRTAGIYRNMSCAPCYLANADDCPRQLACIRQLEPMVVHQLAQKFLARQVAVQARVAFGGSQEIAL